MIGLDKVIAEMKKQKTLMGARVPIALSAAGVLLQAGSQKVVPVDLGPLKASAFTRRTGIGFASSVRVGYTSAYAPFVHEKVDMKLKGQKRPAPSKGRYWDPQGRAQAKFLEEPARRMAPELREAFRRFAKLKGTP